MSIDMDFFNPPRVEPYDPLPPATGHLTVNVERQRQSRDNWTLGMVETEPTGRMRIVIEGEADSVAPFMEAIHKVLAVQNTESKP